MQKNKECEIVQDLLFSYEDDVLNASSKKLVESHLKECENCQKKWMEIKEERTEEKKQVKEIDYLKKIRRKAKIKIILSILAVLLFIFLLFYGYRFFIIHRLTKQYENYRRKDNFYQETTQLSEQGEGAFISKKWYKDGKYKQENYTYTEENGYQLVDTQYGEVGNKQKILITDHQAVKENWPWDEKKENIFYFPGGMQAYSKKFLFQLAAPFITSIKVDTWHVGKEYYILQMDRTEYWFEKDTGLPIREINQQAETTYYPNTTIEKHTGDVIITYHYEFDGVKDEDVTVPDLTNYEVREDNSILELLD